MLKPLPWFHSTRRALNSWSDFVDWPDLAWIKSDYYETTQEWVLMMEIPGLSPQHEVDIRVERDSLFISGGSQHQEQFDSGNSRYESEMSFSYVVPLPKGLKNEKMKAELNRQLLTVRIPKNKRSAIR